MIVAGKEFAEWARRCASRRFDSVMPLICKENVGISFFF